MHQQAPELHALVSVHIPVAGVGQAVLTAPAITIVHDFSVGIVFDQLFQILHFIVDFAAELIAGNRQHILGVLGGVIRRLVVFEPRCLLLLDIDVCHIAEGLITVIAAVLVSVVDELQTAVFIAQVCVASGTAVKYERSRIRPIGIRCSVSNKGWPAVIMHLFDLVQRQFRDGLPVSVLDLHRTGQIRQADAVVSIAHVVQNVVEVHALVHPLDLFAPSGIPIDTAVAARVPAFHVFD